MKLDSPVRVIEETNADTTSVEMGMHEESLGILMDAMTNLYDDPISAPVREYITNGLDSHVEAGTERPVEVWLPTQSDPKLVVQDYGTGMSKQQLLDVYSQYGYSTKRNTDDQAGMWGLGSKSALAYGNSFMVDAVKNGRRTIATVVGSEGVAGRLTAVHESYTSDPNGVTIAIPVREQDFGKFADAVRYLALFLPDKSIAIDGEPYSPPRDGWRHVGNGIYLAPRESGVGYQDVIVMAGVAYNAGSKLSKGAMNNVVVVAYVNPRDIDISASREQVRETEKTAAKIEEIASSVRDLAIADVQQYVDAAETPIEAYRRWANYPVIFGDAITYKGEFLKNPINIPGPVMGFAYSPLRLLYNHTVRGLNVYRSRGRHKVLYVYNAPIDEKGKPTWTKYMETKIRRWLTDGRDGSETLLAVAFSTKRPEPVKWLEAEFADYAEIEAYRIPRAPSKPRDTSTHWVTHGAAGARNRNRLLLDDIPQDDPVVLVSSRMARLDFLPLVGYTVLELPKNRHDKYIRDNEHLEFVSLDAALAEMLSRLSGRVSKREWGIISAGSSAPRGVKRLASVMASCVDPELKAMADVLDGSISPEAARSLDGIEHINTLVRRAGATEALTVKPFERPESPYNFDKVYEKYPLLHANLISTSSHQHKVEYINLFYNSRRSPDGI